MTAVRASEHGAQRWFSPCSCKGTQGAGQAYAEHTVYAKRMAYAEHRWLGQVQLAGTRFDPFLLTADTTCAALITGEGLITERGKERAWRLQELHNAFGQVLSWRQECRSRE